MSKREPLSTLGQPVPELPVEDVERAQQYYRDILGFEIGWLDPGKEMGAVSRGDAVVFFRRTKPPFAPAVEAPDTVTLTPASLLFRKTPPVELAVKFNALLRPVTSKLCAVVPRPPFPAERTILGAAMVRPIRSS